jgi:hypothetical protein
MGEIGSTDDFILEARDKSNVPQLYFYTSAPDAPTMHQSSLIGLLCLAVLPPANAQQQPPKEGTPPPTFEFGFEQRVRNEDWNNILDYSGRTDDEREQIRYRTRGWFKAPLSSDVDVFVGLNQETNQKLGKDNRFDEIIFENAYIDIKKLFVKGLSLRVGRQNLMKGEGFLLFEGTPGDGSRTIYFNAVDLVYTRKKSKIELIGILQPKYDRLFPVIHDQHKPLQDWDQSSLGFYYTDNNHKNMPFEAYYFYTKEVKDYLPATNPQFQPDRHVSTLGGRTVRQFLHGWSATGEFAVQWGAQHPDVVVHGWGGYTYVKKQFAGGWKPYLQAGWWGFSGDDPNTSGTIEGWDPLYSRWPNLLPHDRVPSLPRQPEHVRTGNRPRRECAGARRFHAQQALEGACALRKPVARRFLPRPQHRLLPALRSLLPDDHQDDHRGVQTRARSQAAHPIVRQPRPGAVNRPAVQRAGAHGILPI